jgi:hypothetical protein
MYRVMTRARSDCITSGKCDINDPVLRNASRWLIKPLEHTWGLPGVGNGETSEWSNEQFAQDRKNEPYHLILCVYLCCACMLGFFG